MPSLSRARVHRPAMVLGVVPASVVMGDHDVDRCPCGQVFALWIMRGRALALRSAMTSTPLSDAARRIVALRKDLGLTMRAFGQRCKMDWIHRIEKGDRGVNWDTARRIGEAFGVRPEWIMTGEGMRDVAPAAPTMGRVRDVVGFAESLAEIREQLGESANDEALDVIGETIVSALPTRITPHYLSLLLPAIELGLRSMKARKT